MPVQYKQFKVGEIFRLVNPKGKLTTKQLVSGTDIAYVAAKKTNNGVAMMCSRENIPDEQVMPGNCIVFVQQGDGSAGYTTYQPNDFYAISCVCCGYIDGILNEKIGLYLVSVLDKNKALYSHSNSWSGEKLLNTKMPLPVTPSGAPDWDYMQEYISELEQERVSELEQERVSELEKYLAATGLDDYELTDDDREVLEISGFRRDEGPDSAAAAGLRKEMGEFRIAELFEQLRGKEAAPNRVPDGNVNMINETSVNNGITKKASSEYVFQPPAITVSVNYAETVFVQAEEFCASVNILILKNNALVEFPEAALYVAGLLQKNNRRYDYSHKISKDRLNDTLLLLPICTDAANNPVIDPAKTYHPEGYIPDWDFMSRYIRAIEKMVVKDVVDYKNEFIARTKAVVS